MPEHLEIVIKPTLQCNGMCDYCNVAERPLFMDVSVVEKLFLSLSHYMDQDPGCTSTVLWHGGEPMLMGTGFFENVLELDRKILAGRPTHLMQSNLTLVTEDLLDVLRELLNGGGIGTSLDPFEDYRKLKGGASYFERWYDGFESAKARGFRVGMVYVAHGRSLEYAKRVYYYFRNLGVDSLTLIPLEEPAGLFEGARLAPLAWGRFLAEIYESWKNDDCPLPVEPFAGWESLQFDSDSSARSYNESLSCCEPTLAISPEGDVYPCVRLLDVAVGKIGNLLEDTLDTILARPDVFWRSTRRELIRLEDCGSCRWWKYCAGGCAAASGPRCKTTWCEGYKLFFGGVYE